MAKKRPSFGDQVSKGIRDAYTGNAIAQPAVPAIESPAEPEKRTAPMQSPVPPPSKRISLPPGENPYYEYHPATGARGGRLGAPRKSSIRTQFSLGCTKEDKALYQRAAEMEGRSLPDFINRAVKEYIRLHGLDE